MSIPPSVHDTKEKNTPIRQADGVKLNICGFDRDSSTVVEVRLQHYYGNGFVTAEKKGKNVNPAKNIKN
jgi:hypothetical protein